MTFCEAGGMKDKSRMLTDITDIDNMILITSNRYHFIICDIGITARSCLGIVSIKSEQRAIDTLLRK